MIYYNYYIYFSNKKIQLTQNKINSVDRRYYEDIRIYWKISLSVCCLFKIIYNHRNKLQPTRERNAPIKSADGNSANGVSVSRPWRGKAQYRSVQQRKLGRCIEIIIIHRLKIFASDAVVNHDASPPSFIGGYGWTVQRLTLCCELSPRYEPSIIGRWLSILRQPAPFTSEYSSRDHELFSPKTSALCPTRYSRDIYKWFLSKRTARPIALLATVANTNL